MPRLTWRFIGPANGTGEREHKYLCDISEKLSAHYGNLVRQSNNFIVRQVNIRVFNPDEFGETTDDEVLAVSGMLNYYEPTRNRAKAWANGFEAWLNNRKALGIKSRGADFRVGLASGYSTDVGMFGDGVKFNAWINADDDPLMLNHSDTEQSLFKTWNANVAGGVQPTNANGGFGHWAQKDVDSIGDELDFITNENVYYKDDEANADAATVPFQCNFSAWFDNGTSDPADFGSASNSEKIMGPLNIMCGLVGVYVDTVTVDDSETENQDYGIEISMDVQKWTPISKMLGGKSKRRKGGKR